MSIKEQLNDDLKKAMKSGDTAKRSVLRLLLSSIHNAEIAKRSPLDDSGILGVLSKEAKQREESILAYRQGNRNDLVEKEQAELVVIQEYLPAQMSRDDIVAEVRRVIEEVGAQGPRDKGKVMPKLVAALKGRADGRVINDVVTELLGS